MKAHPVRLIVIVVFLGVFLGLAGFAAVLDAHKEPFYHATCPICKWQHELSVILVCVVTSVSMLFVASRNLRYKLNQPVFKQFHFACYRLRAPPFVFPV